MQRYGWVGSTPRVVAVSAPVAAGRLRHCGCTPPMPTPSHDSASAQPRAGRGQLTTTGAMVPEW